MSKRANKSMSSSQRSEETLLKISKGFLLYLRFYLMLCLANFNYLDIFKILSVSLQLSKNARLSLNASPSLESRKFIHRVSKENHRVLVDSLVSGITVRCCCFPMSDTDQTCLDFLAYVVMVEGT